MAEGNIAETPTNLVASSEEQKPKIALSRARNNRGITSKQEKKQPAEVRRSIAHSYAAEVHGTRLLPAERDKVFNRITAEHLGKPYDVLSDHGQNGHEFVGTFFQRFKSLLRV